MVPNISNADNSPQLKTELDMAKNDTGKRSIYY